LLADPHRDNRLIYQGLVCAPPTSAADPGDLTSTLEQLRLRARKTLVPWGFRGTIAPESTRPAAALTPRLPLEREGMERMSTRKQTEETLRESERFLRNVFDAIQDGISALDCDLNIIRVNQWMERMYAIRKPLVGRKCYAVYQTDGSAKREYGGCKGLTLVREIIEAHNGKVAVDSEVGKGSTFTITLPISNKG
jgi:PAS domain-containing protein